MLKDKSVRSYFYAFMLVSVLVSTGFAFQSPGFYYDEDKTLCDLAKKSDLIVTGRVSETLPVVDPAKKDKEFALWNERVESGEVDFKYFPERSKYVTGTFYTFDVGDVIFSKTDLMANDTISVLVKGYPLVLHSNIPYFSSETKYLLHLSGAGTEDFEPNSMIWKLGNGGLEKPKFEKERMFVLTPGAIRFPPLSESDSDLVKKAKMYSQHKNECAAR